MMVLQASNASLARQIPTPRASCPSVSREARAGTNGGPGSDAHHVRVCVIIEIAGAVTGPGGALKTRLRPSRLAL